MRDIMEITTEIEKFMFLRGEYDFGPGDRIRWIADSNVPESYQLCSNPATLNGARVNVISCICNVLTGTASEDLGGIEPLMSYLNDQTYEVSEDDELISVAEKLIAELNQILMYGMGGRS